MEKLKFYKVYHSFVNYLTVLLTTFATLFIAWYEETFTSNIKLMTDLPKFILYRFSFKWAKISNLIEELPTKIIMLL
jgi:hypothetical protein